MNTVKSLKTTKGGSMSANSFNGPSALEPASQADLRAGVGDRGEFGPPLLTPFQLESVSLFVHAFSALSMPRSIGEVYGLLFSTDEPLSLDDVMERLQMSRGSANEGLRWLKSLGAASVVYLPGVRKEYFKAETSLRKMATGFMREKIEPHLDNGAARLEALEKSIDGRSRTAAFEKSRLGQVKSWYGFFGKMLPMIKALAAKF